MNTLRDQVWEILHDVYDPEIPLNIADLGLIYDLQVSEAGEVSILMTLTSPAAPWATCSLTKSATAR